MVLTSPRSWVEVTTGGLAVMGEPTVPAASGDCDGMGADACGGCDGADADAGANHSHPDGQKFTHIPLNNNQATNPLHGGSVIRCLWYGRRLRKG